MCNAMARKAMEPTLWLGRARACRCALCMKPMLELEKSGPRAASASGAVAGASSRSHAPRGRSLLLTSCGAGRRSTPLQHSADADTEHAATAASSYSQKR